MVANNKWIGTADSGLFFGVINGRNKYHLQSIIRRYLAMLLMTLISIVPPAKFYRYSKGNGSFKGFRLLPMI
jgi:hypothetical protein